MHPMLTTAVKAARKAGGIITRASHDLDKLTVRRKRHNDFVSEVDHAAEEAVISILREAYPGHGFLAEESGAHDAKAEYVWVIDPLDGTTDSGRSAFRNGTWPRARCWCAKPAGSSAISKERTATWKAAAWSPRTRSYSRRSSRPSRRRGARARRSGMPRARSAAAFACA